ncbi:uncharacterized protein ACHE_31264S [Aspergillus chevalieri]|uniref:Uncharacterized protein n=1 Tax=Aspergillus chevalieri TaxID=182096 RepID=A0A7R7VMM8_ASPCH|nr:uncharacterized protein ACHE_31264S [Aspergillus chevalieri]BCR87277.1 hypothetical protein ACHE_31264S [Aspergillus chevalieri]
MELVAGLHVQLSELVLCSSDTIRVVIYCFQMVEHVLRIGIWVHCIIPHAWDDVLSGFTLTTAHHICLSQLRCVKMICIGCKLLTYQEQPVFKSGFFAVSEHWGIRNLCRLAGDGSGGALLCTGSSVHHHSSYLGSEGVSFLISFCFLMLQGDQFTVLLLVLEFQFHYLHILLCGDSIELLVDSEQLVIEILRVSLIFSNKIIIGQVMGSIVRFIMDPQGLSASIIIQNLAQFGHGGRLGFFVDLSFSSFSFVRRGHATMAPRSLDRANEVGVC